jgi:hypothetical protein
MQAAEMLVVPQFEIVSYPGTPGWSIWSEEVVEIAIFWRARGDFLCKLSFKQNSRAPKAQAAESQSNIRGAI